MNRLACILTLTLQCLAQGIYSQCPFAAALNSTGNCIGDTLSIRTDVAISQIVWLVGSVVDKVIYTADTVYRPLQAGTYRAAISDDNGCSVTVGPVVLKGGNNVIPVNISPSIMPVCSGKPITFTATASSTDPPSVYQWLVNGVNAGANGTDAIFIDGPQFTSSSLSNGDIITCMVLDNNTCDAGTSNSITALVNTSCPIVTPPPVPPISIPNAFTPNGDGNNEVFYIRGGPQGSRIKDFSIFNRWGQKIFQRTNIPTDNPAFGWNGFYRGAAVIPETYIYTVTLLLADKSTRVFRGTVILIR
ncbi:MAG TPA: gliding motility-associated C-terminal domain-containing protein [Puia sp.]|jgi:gliding motility-associated-like protein